MSEIRLQSEIARKFSELFPLKRGQLFHVSNERNNAMQAMQARAIGIFPGVADFLYFQKKPGFEVNGVDVKSSIYLIAIEVKEPGTRHKREHIEQQLEWARILKNQGGTWRLVRSVEEAICCTELNFQGLTIQEVEIMLKNVDTKTIKF